MLDVLLGCRRLCKDSCRTCLGESPVLVAFAPFAGRAEDMQRFLDVSGQTWIVYIVFAASAEIRRKMCKQACRLTVLQIN